MIFLSVGTHPQPFDRLLKKVDELIEEKIVKEKVVAQTGVSKFFAKNISCKPFYDFKELEGLMKKSSMIITHAGAGSIIDAVNLKKPLIVVPRLKKFGEHTNDHQMELAAALEKSGLLVVVYDIEELENAILIAKKIKHGIKSGGELSKKLENYIEHVVIK